MNEFQLALLIGAIVVLAISTRLPRASLWVGAGALSFVASTAYARYDMPHPSAFTLACDAGVCLAAYFFGRERWEENIYRIFQLSVLLSLLRMSNLIGDQWLYVVSLELLNWAALLLIGGTAIVDRARAHGGNSHRHWLPDFHRSDISLRKARQTQPFHKVRR